MSERHYVVKNPRGHRQKGASKKALDIRSERPHAHVVKKEAIELPDPPPPRAKDTRLEGITLARAWFRDEPCPKDAPCVFLIPRDLVTYLNGTTTHKAECRVPPT